MFDWFRKKHEAKLPFVTDIHCHLVPNVDDGSDSEEKSVEILRHMSQWGIQRLFVTPHYIADRFENDASTIDPPFESLKRAVADAGINITLEAPSGEYRLDDYFVSLVETNRLRPIGKDYLLIENAFVQEPMGIDDTIFELLGNGYKPILAHPERYRYYAEDPERYRQLHNDGVLFQCNILSLAGYYGKEIKAVAEKLVENDLVDFLGSDVHGMRHVQCIEKYMGTSHFTKLADSLKDRLYNDRI